MRCLDYARHDMGRVDATFPRQDWMLMPQSPARIDLLHLILIEFL